MKATGLKNWYRRRERALSPGPPLWITRGIRKEPMRLPRLPKRPCHEWYDNHKRILEEIKAEMAERLEAARRREEEFTDTTAPTLTVTGPGYTITYRNNTDTNAPTIPYEPEVTFTTWVTVG